jgi:OFA family oxalate/formate antiporter-like MFS transporter
MNLNNRWVQLGASLVAMIMIANLQYSWTLFVKPIQAATGWKLSEISLAFTLFILFQTWVQPLDGWLIDRLGPRLFVTVAGVLCGAGWAYMGSATTLPQLYASYMLAGVGAALVYSGSIGSALKWFPDRRGLAAGIMAAGFGGGTALFIPVIARLIRTSGYGSAFFWTGLFQGIVIVIVAQFLRHPPAEILKTAVVKAGSAIGRRTSDHFTTWEMLRTPHFYALYLMFVMMATGGLLVTAQAGPVATSWGISLAALTLATTLSPIANGLSRISWGWVSDRIGRETTMMIAFSLQAICLLMVLTIGRLSGGLFTLSLVLVFFTWGEVFSLFPAITGDYFGSRYATSNYGFMYSAKGVASILGGVVAALLYERFGSWTACFYGSAALALCAAVMAVGLRAMPLPVRRTAELSPAMAPAVK